MNGLEPCETEQQLQVVNLKVMGLDPISFSLNCGEAAALMGPSGSGKTLLLRALADLDPAQGNVFCKDHEKSSLSGPEWRKRVRYSAAEPGWWEDIAYMHFKDVELAGHFMQQLGLDPILLNKPIFELSTGERQRLALVLVLCDQPDVMLLDEPTAALDATATKCAEELIKKQQAKGKILLFATHSQEQAERLADKIFVIEERQLRLKD